MLTINLNIGIGLCNGSIGKVQDFVLNDDLEVEYILIEFQEGYSGPNNFLKNGPKNVVPIKIFTAKYGPKKGPYAGYSYWMKQFPLVLAYCFTVEKVQGMTISENCYIDLGTNNKGGLT